MPLSQNGFPLEEKKQSVNKSLSSYKTEIFDCISIHSFCSSYSLESMWFVSVSTFEQKKSPLFLFQTAEALFDWDNM